MGRGAGSLVHRTKTGRNTPHMFKIHRPIISNLGRQNKGLF